MITFIKGDIFEQDEDGVEALVNPVNTLGVSGKGLALEFKKRFPLNQVYYETACKSETGLIGIGNVLVTDHEELKIINFPTKLHWRNASRLEYIDSGLKSLVDKIKLWNIKSVAVPKLGCGLGGLKWDEVRDLMLEHFIDLEGIDIRIYGDSNA